MASNTVLALSGNLQKTFDSRTKAYLSGLRTGTVDSSSQTKTNARNDILKAGFKRRVATTMQDNIYPKQGLSYEPSAIIYSKASHIISSHADGGTQRPRYSKFLAVPIEGGPAERLRQKPGVSLIDTFFDRFGNDSLHFVNRPGKAPLLVARMRSSAAGKFRGITARKATKTRGSFTSLDGLVSVPVFTMVRSVRMVKRLRTRQILEKGARRHPARLVFSIKREMATSMAETAVR